MRTPQEEAPTVDQRVWRKDGGLRTNRYGLIFIVRSYDTPPRVLYIGHIAKDANLAARAHPGGGGWYKLGEKPEVAEHAAAEAREAAEQQTLYEQARTKRDEPCCAACAKGKPCTGKCKQTRATRAALADQRSSVAGLRRLVASGTRR